MPHAAGMDGRMDRVTPRRPLLYCDEEQFGEDESC